MARSEVGSSDSDVPGEITRPAFVLGLQDQVGLSRPSINLIFTHVYQQPLGHGPII